MTGDSAALDAFIKAVTTGIIVWGVFKFVSQFNSKKDEKPKPYNDGKSVFHTDSQFTTTKDVVVTTYPNGKKPLFEFNFKPHLPNWRIKYKKKVLNTAEKIIWSITIAILGILSALECAYDYKFIEAIHKNITELLCILIVVVIIELKLWSENFTIKYPVIVKNEKD